MWVVQSMPFFTCFTLVSGTNSSMISVSFQLKNHSKKLFNQGMILGTSYRDHRGALVALDKVEKRDGSFFHVETGEELEQAPAKMSKSLKNVVNPDDVVEQYGADTLRCL